jgi:hypothetical protein
MRPRPESKSLFASFSSEKEHSSFLICAAARQLDAGQQPV